MPTPVKTSRNYFAALAAIQQTLGASRDQAREIWLSLKQRSGVAPSVGAIRKIPKRSRPALKAAATRRLKAEPPAKPTIPTPKPKQQAKIIQIGPDGIRYVVGIIPPTPERPPAATAARTEPIRLRKPPAPEPRPVAEVASISERKPRNKFERQLWMRKLPYLSGEAAKLAAKLWRSPKKQAQLADILQKAYRSIAKFGKVSDNARELLRKFVASADWPEGVWFAFLKTLYA